MHQDYTIAREYYERAFESDECGIGANFRIGNFYKDGLGVEQDYTIAREYYERAAQRNHGPALYWLGFLYENGLGVEQNYDRAIEYYTSAIEFHANIARNALLNLQDKIRNQPEKFPENNFENFALKLRCSICMDNAVNVATIECGHLLCYECFNSLSIPKSCPICRFTPITIMRIFYGGYKQKYLKYKHLKNKY